MAEGGDPRCRLQQVCDEGRRVHDRSAHVAEGPSEWVRRYAPLIAPGAQVLDLACGNGRHTRYLLDLGHRVTAVDRDVSGVVHLTGDQALELLRVDLEDGRAFPLADRSFVGVVVTNYLHRPLLPALVSAVAPGGVLIYETFARGQERFGPPNRPEFLLEPGELLEAVRGRLRVLGYEDVVVDGPKAKAVQRIAATRPPDSPEGAMRPAAAAWPGSRAVRGDRRSDRGR